MRYVVSKQRGESTAWYWQVPTRLKVKTEAGLWPEGTVRLPDDAEERRKTAMRLNDELDSLRRGNVTHGGRGSLPDLIREYERSSYFTSLRERTREGYDLLSRRVLQWSQEKGHPQVSTLTTPKIIQFLERYESRRSLRDHIAKYLAVVLEYARRTGRINYNPARKLGLKRPKRMKPIRIVTVEQVLQIAAKAREAGKPHVAMGVLLHFDLGQRQGDVLRLQKPRDYKDGVFHFHQSKTDQVVTIRPFLQETRDALDALPNDQMMLVAQDKSAVQRLAYWRDFREVANACGFNDLWEMELRHSCVIFCERAGLTPAEIATRTGHGLASVITILENYRYRDPVVAAHGALKLEAYRNKLQTKV